MIMQGRGVSSAHRLNFYPEARLPSQLLPRVTLHLFRRHGQLCLPSLCPGSCGSGHLTSLDGSLKGPAPGAGGTGDPILCVCDELLLRAGAAGHWGPRGDRTLLESASSGDHGAGSLGPRCPALPSHSLHRLVPRAGSRERLGSTLGTQRDTDMLSLRMQLGHGR